MDYRKCELCARRCFVNRESGEIGRCRSSAIPRVSRAALHMWEEPIISGTRGSGTIFFSGCSLGCVFCQNAEISRGRVGNEVTDTELADMMLRLSAEGAHNINLVTPTHFLPSVISSVTLARERGLSIPIVYNTSSYETPEAVRSLSDTVDIFLADFKFFRKETARELASAENYPEVARAAISEMVKISPRPVIEDGIMKSGVIVRILLLPGHVAEAKLILKYLYQSYGENIYYSLMSQYTPMDGMTGALSRRVTKKEYSELLEYADRLGIGNAFVQGEESAGREYIPEFEI